MDGTEFHDVTITVEDDKEDKIVVKAYDVEMDTNGDFFMFLKFINFS